MENGSFHAHLPDFEMQETTTQPRAASLQSLIQQNEDLTIRLKMAIQKMASLEDDNEQLSVTQRKLENTVQALSDQLLIWKEKERLWQERFNKSEFKLAELKRDMPDISDLKNELNRYYRYHEKVKNQIKPYIQQLKEYARGLSEHIKSLNTEIDRKEFDNRNLVDKLATVEKELASHLTTNAKMIDDMKTYYETELVSYKSESVHLREALIVAENRCQNLDQALERQDDLLNQNILLKRQLEASKEAHQSDTEGLRQSLQMARSEILQKSARADEQESQLKRATSELEQKDHQLREIQEQMSSLRFMWNEKCDELEKMKLAASALEKLNVELSLKLKEARQP
jgi:chromosome segregation ATPase